MDLESEALREAYASAPVDTAILDTLEVAVAGEDSVFLTNNYTAFTAAIETGVSTTFQAIPFTLALPDKEADSLPTMKLVIANPGEVVSNFIRNAKDSKKFVIVKYRPFLATNLGATITYQLPVPMTFYLGPVKLDVAKVEAQCLFPDITNRRFPNEMYTIRKFPGLRGWG